MNFFDHLKNILVSKNPPSCMEGFSPYMINRWMSFISPATCKAINESVNCLGNIDKDIHYKLLLSAFPKQKYMPKIKYIKKHKDEKEENNDPQIAILSKTLERSQKEIQNLLDFSTSLQ